MVVGDTYGRHRPSRHETVAAAVHYRSPGRHMGIKNCPNGYELNELGTRPVPGVQGCPCGA